MKVLLIEDDVVTAHFIATGLKQSGILTIHANDGTLGLKRALEDTYDVAIVDIMLPGMNGLALISEMRRMNIRTPVLIVSVKDSVDDKVSGLQLGGDDYLTKPFAFIELLARLQALVRRSTNSSDANMIAAGDLRMDLRSRKVFRDNCEIVLQPKEFALLEFLLRRQGHILTKTIIRQQVWEYDFDTNTNIVEARICRLREKVDRPFSNRLIHTVRGAGYVLEVRRS